MSITIQEDDDVAHMRQLLTFYGDTPEFFTTCMNLRGVSSPLPVSHSNYIHNSATAVCLLMTRTKKDTSFPNRCLTAQQQYAGVL